MGLESGTPVDLNRAVRTIDRAILSDDVPHSDVDNNQNNQSHNPDSMICVRPSIQNGIYPGNQSDGRTKSYSIAFTTFGANEQSKLPKSGGLSPQRTRLNLEQLSSRRIEKRKFDENVSRSSSKSKKLNSDSPLLIDLTNNGAVLPIIDMTCDTDPVIAFMNDRFKAAKFPYRVRFLGIPQSSQESEIPLTPSHPAFQNIVQQRQVMADFILSAEQNAIIGSAVKMDLESVLVHFRQTLQYTSTNRDVLRRLWEADEDLRRMGLYNDQVKLSDLIRVIEDKLAEVIAKLQRQLWYRNRLRLLRRGVRFQKAKKPSPGGEISGSLNR